MPLVSTSSKQSIFPKYELIKTLEEKCKACKLFYSKDADQTYVYSVTDLSPTYHSMIAVSKYGDRYALYASEDLTDKEMGVFAYFLDDAEKKMNL